jgi:DNA processing protein
VIPSWATQLAAGGCEESTVRAVRLAATPSITPERIRKAVEQRLDRPPVGAADVMAVLEREAGPELADDAATAGAANRLRAHGAVVRVVGHAGYPTRLDNAWPELGAPLWIFVKAPGDVLPETPAVAIVGTRQPTLDGTKTAGDLAHLLARHGVTVVSGMARGIDQAGHLGALRAGGATVGVLGSGFGVDYPYRDGPVRDAVAASGGLVTELLPGTRPQKRSFLWRNRIIAALADITVVVEGRAQSGALHTARMAAAQGRDVMAVPGSVSAPSSRAPLDLIRDGAIPVTRLDDVVALLGLTGRSDTAVPEHPTQLTLPPAVSETARDILRLLGAVPAPPRSLAAAVHQPIGAVLAAVSELTGHGLAAVTPRGVVIRQPAAASPGLADVVAAARQRPQPSALGRGG